MARLLPQTLTRLSSSPSPSPSSLALSSRAFAHRNRSSKSGKAQLIEVDLESDGEVEVLGIRKLEDVIHSIIVRRSAPDWLPFIPGSSYWVPPKPRRPYNVVEMVGKLAASPLNDDQSMALTTVRGWPSSSYFIEGSASMHPVPLEVDVEVETNSENAARSEEEG